MNLGGPWCKHCVDEVEDILHVLRDCPPLAKGIWCAMCCYWVEDNFFNMNLHYWINLKQDREEHHTVGSIHALIAWQNPTNGYVVVGSYEVLVATGLEVFRRIYDGTMHM
ncbi:hypothetical protein TSUD_131670 [Trifolium subterraneum]|uniref:Reverse transcriptase zinc-binding domain-containing protein n=1 Tax=Trifolium subterraneum TaxID=3900 RepID=A0A2Z6LWC9_TRISU|nr:hypothetical protein TSUD_131670 [Trifolium subterraneum]